MHRKAVCCAVSQTEIVACGERPGGLPAWTSVNQKVYTGSTVAPGAAISKTQYGKGTERQGAGDFM